ncbi:MAG: pitrilysin family protein [Bacteroidota bacterium]
MSNAVPTGSSATSASASPGSPSSVSPSPVTEARVPLSERVAVHDAGHARVLALPTPIDDVVSFRGSFWTAPDLGAGEELLQTLTVLLLDKGTQARDRFAVAEALEDRGAQLSFYSDDLRVGFSGRALRDDLPAVLDLLAEQLRTPLLDVGEFAKAQAQVAAGIRRSMDATGSQAAGLLNRRLYGPAHPNYMAEPADELATLEAYTVDDVRAYHAAHFGGTKLRLALAGDLDPAQVAQRVEAALGDWAPHGTEARYDHDAAPTTPGTATRVIADKQNLDVRIGHPLALRRDHDDFLALYLGVYVLGGNFSARLMSHVRDDLGLTYGIGAQLAGIAVEHDGHLLTRVTLSGPNLERGIEATLGEIRRFVEDGITSDELAEKQTTIAGTYAVGLGTTRGLATSLLVNAERGFDLAYLDQYPDRIHALTLDEVNAAIHRHLDPDALHVGIAGTLPEVG